MNSDDITFAYIIRDYTDEYVFTSNKFKNRLQNIILIVSGNYELKLPHYAYKKLKLKDIYTKIGLESIFDNANTNWVMFMKPEEAFHLSINISDLKVDNYWVIVEKFINRDKINNLIYGEIKLFHRDSNFENVPKYAPLNIVNYEIFFPIINQIKAQAYLYEFANNKSSLKSIIYLFDKRLINIDLGEIYKEYYDENESFPEMLELIRLYSEKLIISKNIIEAEDILIKGLINFPNSPSLNSLLAEVYFIKSDYTNAEIFIKKCIEMWVNKSFYIYLSFNPAIITYAAYQFLARIYAKQKMYDEAKKSYEQAIYLSGQRENIIREYKSYLTKISKNNDYINELDFSCQSCGNCCRFFRNVNVTHFDVLRIMENKPELEFEDIVDIVKLKRDTSIKDSNIPQVIQDKDNVVSMYILKKKDKSNECIFLENNMCSINEYKPIDCKTWPFTSISNKIVTWTENNREFIKRHCAFKAIEGSNNPDELLNLINISKAKNQVSNEILEKWVDKIDMNNIPKEFMDEIKKNYP